MAFVKHIAYVFPIRLYEKDINNFLKFGSFEKLRKQKFMVLFGNDTATLDLLFEIFSLTILEKKTAKLK